MSLRKFSSPTWDINKNFSLIREHDGEWHLSKAFDRSFLSEDFKTRCRALVRERLVVFGLFDISTHF